jgi:hypothetical protein
MNDIGNDTALAKAGIGEVDLMKQTWAEEAQLDVEQAAVEVEDPATDAEEPGEEYQERPPAEDDETR